MPDSWDQMSVSEKADWLRKELDRFINHQNGANMRLTNRIKALEDAAAAEKARTGNPQQ